MLGANFSLQARPDLKNGLCPSREQQSFHWNSIFFFFAFKHCYMLTGLLICLLFVNCLHENGNLQRMFWFWTGFGRKNLSELLIIYMKILSILTKIFKYKTISCIRQGAQIHSAYSGNMFNANLGEHLRCSAHLAKVQSFNLCIRKGGQFHFTY